MLDFERNLVLRLLLSKEFPLILEQVPEEYKFCLLQIINTYGQPQVLTCMESINQSIHNIECYSNLIKGMQVCPSPDILNLLNNKLLESRQNLNSSIKQLQDTLKAQEDIQSTSVRGTNVPSISNEVLQQTNSSNRLPPSVNLATDSTPLIPPFNSAADSLNSPTPFWSLGSPNPFVPAVDWTKYSAFSTPAFHEDSCAPSITLAKR